MLAPTHPAASARMGWTAPHMSDPAPRILALPRYGRKGASSRLRFHDHVRYLKEAGFRVEVRPFFDDEYLERQYAGLPSRRAALAGHFARRFAVLRERGGFDLAWVEKEALPFLPLAVEARMLDGVPLVLDFDDAWHERYARHGSGAVRSLLGRKLERLVARSAVVTVGNEWMRDWARQAGAAEVVKLPTPVELAAYPHRPPPSEGFRVGWIGTPASARYLPMLGEPLRALSATGPVTLVTIGAAPAHLPGVAEEFHPWREEEEGERLAGVHVVVMPVPDEPFERGKSGYKIIQAMAAGRPVVASPVGENRVLLADSGCGLLATTGSDWRAALSCLRANPELCRRMGEAGRARARLEFDQPVVADRLVGLLRQVARTRQP